MKKDLNWLKKEMEDIYNFTAQIKGDEKHSYDAGAHNVVSDILSMINEVEQQELPVIPVYIGEFIEFCKAWEIPLIRVMFETVEMVESMDEMAGRIEKWIVKNSEKFALAYALGYKVEDGKKRVKINIKDLFSQIEKKLCLEHLKPVEFTRGERFGQHGYVKEITKEITSDMTIELFVEEITNEG